MAPPTIPPPQAAAQRAMARLRELIADPNLSPETRAKLERVAVLTEAKALLLRTLAVKRAKEAAEKAQAPGPRDVVETE